MAKLLLGDGAMQDSTTPAQPVSERDLDEVLRSLEVELFGPPPKRERDDATAIHILPPRH